MIGALSSWPRVAPIVERELLARLRSGWSWAALALPPALQSVALLALLDHYFRKGWDPSFAQPRDRAFLGVFAAGALSIGLLLPAVASTAFTRERADRTLPLLAATGLAPAEVYAAKLLSALFCGAGLVLASLPVWVLAWAELAPRSVGASLACLGALVLLEVAVGLFWSVLAPASWIAALLAYATTAWACGLAGGLWAWVAGGVGWRVAWWGPVSALLLGLAALFVALGVAAARQEGLAES